MHTSNPTYHSLQVTVERRFSRDFSFLAFYTWSKAIDLESANNQFTISNLNPFDPAFNRWDITKLRGPVK